MAKKTRQKKPTRQGRPVMAYINAALVEGIHSFAADTKRTLTAALEMALEAFLRQEGRWPVEAGGEETHE